MPDPAGRVPLAGGGGPTPRSGPSSSALAVLVVLAVLAVTVVAGGCGGGDDAGTQRVTITVAGATSAAGALTEIGDDFEAANPDVEIDFTFGSSATLATQILEGAPADVFASADEANMTTLGDAGLVSGTPAPFARNVLVIVTKPGNPAGIETLADLADAGVISLCGEEAPCGKYAAQALADARVTIDESNVTRGQNVGATLTAVVEGDAVAGIVYATDAAAAGDSVAAVAIPADIDVVATYPIATLASSTDPEVAEVAEAFVAHVLSAEGQAVLAEYGFLPPT